MKLRLLGLSGLFAVALGPLTLAQTAPSQPSAVPTAAPGAPVGACPKATPADIPDWAGLDHYRAEDAKLPPPSPGEQRVVFMGDSITDIWGRLPDRGSFFPGKPYVNRGISGQTTAQMLLRFQQDVIHLHPAAVVLLGGANDIAGNTGPSTPAMIEDNLASMAEVARSNGVRVIMASILPAGRFPWRPALEPAEEIRTLNAWIRSYCARTGATYLDYYDHMADPNGAMLPGLSSDGVHPVTKGFAIMAPLALAAIAETLPHR